MPKSKQQIDAEVAKRGLVSVMNDTKWRELQNAVRGDLPFAPPYQLKVVLNPHPHPEQFEADVDYLGDWSDECFSPFYEIEWIRVRPRYVRGRGRLVVPEVLSVEPEFLAILHRCHIPYRRDSDAIWVYGYVSETSNLVIGSEPNGAASGSQPSRSETNQVSPAAGSRR